MNVRRVLQVMVGVVVVLGVCSWTLYATRVHTSLGVYLALRELRGLSPTIPIPPGAVVLASLEGGDGSRIDACSGAHIYRLYGTNEMSETQVLDWFSSSLPPDAWHPKTVADRVLTFVSDRQVTLEVSDSYRYLPFEKAIVLEGQQRFQTLFLVGLNAYSDADAAKRDCG